MSIKMLRFQSNVCQELNLIFNEIDIKFISKQFKQNCTQIHSETQHVIQLAPKYDYKHLEANGFWTFARLVIKFGQIALTSDESDVTDQLIPVSEVLIIGLSLCRQFGSHETLFDSLPEDFPNLLKVFESIGPQLDVVYGPYCAYWLCPSMKKTMQGFTQLMAIFFNWRNIWTNRAPTVAFIAQNATTDFVKSFWGLSEINFLKTTLPKLAIGLNVAKEVKIQRQTQWVISSSSATVFQTTNVDQSLAPVRCRLLCNDLKERLSVVLHIHGGGFVSQSPDSHELYLRDWARSLSDAAIISVDYSLSPNAKYPTALQQILDVYLFLRSETQKHVLGFDVIDVVVCGDSAGGNMSIALSLVLEQIGEIAKPKAVLSFYAPLILQTRASASRLMTAVDTLLPLGVLLSCLEAYTPKEDEDFEHLSDEDIPESVEDWTPNWSLRLRHSINGLKERLVSEPTLKPWYRSQNINERLNEINEKTKNAFISPLLSESFPKEVPLYLVCLHFDACLDDSIEMAKKWSSSVVIDVIDSLPHGFLNFINFSSEAKRASNLCLDRIKQSLH